MKSTVAQKQTPTEKRTIQRRCSPLVQFRAQLAGLSYAEQMERVRPKPPVGQVQCKVGGGGIDTSQIKNAAAQGVSGSAGELPHLAQIQTSFGNHDVSDVKSHVGGPAAEACEENSAGDMCAADQGEGPGEVDDIQGESLILSNFAQDSDTLKPEHEAAVVRLFNELVADSGEANVRAQINTFDGYSSAEGDCGHNRDLARRRALNVAKKMFQDLAGLEITDDQLKQRYTVAYGEEYASASEGCGFGRRVEVRLVQAVSEPSPRDDAEQDVTPTPPETELEMPAPGVLGPLDHEYVGPGVGIVTGVARMAAPEIAAVIGAQIAGVLGLAGLAFMVYSMLRGWAQVVASEYLETEALGKVYGLAHRLDGSRSGLPRRSPLIYRQLTNMGGRNNNECGRREPWAFLRYDGQWREGIDESREAYDELFESNVGYFTRRNMFDEVSNRIPGLTEEQFYDGLEELTGSRRPSKGAFLQSWIREYASDDQKAGFVQNLWDRMNDGRQDWEGGELTWPLPRPLWANVCR